MLTGNYLGPIVSKDRTELRNTSSLTGVVYRCLLNGSQCYEHKKSPGRLDAAHHNNPDILSFAWIYLC